jgi:hypothetical protein
MSNILSDWHRTPRLLAMPHIMFSPQLWLLKFMEIGPFLLVNIRLFYTLGFLGCCLIARRYRLSLVATCILVLLFNFNGHITAHLGEGHTEWFGYFLLPLFIYFTTDLLGDKPLAIPALWLGLIQFVLLLQGSFHFMIWCLMFLGLMAMITPSRRLFGAWALVALQVFLLGAIRIGPAMTTFADEQLYYIAGYPSVSVLLDSLIVLNDFHAEPIKVIFGPPVTFWEYNMYITEVGLLFLLFFGMSSRFSRARLPEGFQRFTWPMVFMFLLAFGNLYYVAIYRLHVPFLANAERAPARFIIMPMAFLFVMACLRLQRYLDRRRATFTATPRMVLLLGFAAGAYQLYVHTVTWGIGRIDRFPSGNDFGPIHLATIDDPLYIRTLHTSLRITLLSLGCWVGFLIWAYLKRQPRPLPAE